MADRTLLPGEQAILGLLATRPMHGYEMARYFAGDLVDICPVEQSLLYTYIRNVEQRALVHWTEQRVGKRPPRKVYELTAAGRTEFTHWLGEPVERMREIRLEFLLKLYFLHTSDPASALTLLDRQIATCETYLERTARRVRRATGFARFAARSKETAAVATLDWLLEYRAELALPSRHPAEASA